MNDIKSLFSKAINLHQLGDLDQAQHLYQQVLAIDPNHGDSLNNLAAIELARSNFCVAIDIFNRLLHIRPNSASAYSNLSYAYLSLKDFQKSFDACVKAIEIDPSLPDAHNNLGETYSKLNQNKKSAECFVNAHKISPDTLIYALRLYNAQRYACLWSDSMEVKRHLEKEIFNISDEPSFGSLQPFFIAVFFEDAKLLYDVSCNYSKLIERQVLGRVFTHKNKKVWDRKIRIGYLSSDFYNHATCQLIRPLFNLYNHDKFEVYLYSYTNPEFDNDYKQALAKDVDKWVDIYEMDDFSAAKQINDDKIDILFDLKGYTTNTRSQIGAFRPAPIQIAWLGFPGTSGADWIDYMIADKITVPQEDFKFYSEKIIHMPHAYQMNDNKRIISDKVFSRKECDLPEEQFIFASFNRQYKIDPDSFNAWMDILKQTENTSLWIHITSEECEEYILKAAIDAGVDPKRIIFAPFLPFDEHIKRMQLADLVLDSFICNGHTTTSEILWAGTPVLCKYGKHFASRVSASLLNAMDMKQLITYSTDEYIKKAIALSRHDDDLANTRQEIEQKRGTSPLFNSEKFIANLEERLLQIWDNYN